VDYARTTDQPSQLCHVHKDMDVLRRFAESNTEQFFRQSWGLPNYSSKVV